MDHYLDELNTLQRAAAKATEGPVMIIAGAGSGKTRVLTYRIAHIMEKGADAFNILALTFTNKAAKEMKERIAKIVGPGEAKNLWMGTFHSVFAKILRIEASKLGYPSNFTIYDTDDSKSVIKEILKQFNLDDKIYKPSLVLNRISEAKNKLVSAAQYLNNPITQQEDSSSRKPLLGKVYEAYQRRNFKAGAMDFDDLLFQTNVLLRDFPDVLLKYQNKFRFILVDEYQDTNFSQYLIIKQLAARFQNICVVGDDAQSIYAFRGANIQNILNFEKDYPDLKTFKLEQNYRSTKTIVAAANHIIANNKDQFKKTVFTENEDGQKLKVIKAGSDNEEGQKIVNSIFEIRMQNQAKNSDFAILYRTNAQSRSFEESLRKLNIPYKIYGGISFYQRKEIKDVLSYFRLTINSSDDESLRRVINYPARGIGQTTLDKITVAAAEHDINMWTVISNLKDFNLGINAGIASKINDFVTQIKSYSLLLPYKDAYDLANYIAVNSGIVKELYTDKTPEGVSRYENIQELLNGIKDFVEQPRTPQENELNDVIKLELQKKETELALEEANTSIKTLDEFMQEITLLTSVDKEDEKDTDKDKVSMMTIHAAKGLEFPYVYIVGLEENLFPSQLSINSRTDLEEERRLFYVAVTRAEKQATLSYATMRYRFGNVTYCEPSRFIDEIDEKFLDYPEDQVSPSFSKNTFDKFRDNYNSVSNDSNTSIINLNLKPKKLIRLSSSFNSNSTPADLSLNRSLLSGDNVMHEKFGKGQIVSLEGSWPETKATIQFEKAGNKSLLLKFARLTKL
ncbi:ATP-dependent helicase [Aurantibacillus circumpalustris]|uniref:ATP-dependent helicase n=1 Tax=Aurantibacillus circumpalustris TaxID=3036359 RepID=UPI00295B3217|nr:UvrD-helicase domain-containing protein [Aurantibacillus circumpalustris]